MLVVDPMYNLFLGSAKYFVQKILIGTDSHKLKEVNVFHWYWGNIYCSPVDELDFIFINILHAWSYTSKPSAELWNDVTVAYKFWASCIYDFGPLHTFWLYNLPTNNHAIEIQLMQRFSKDNRTFDLISQAESKDLLEEFGEVVLGHAKQFYSLIESPIVDTNC